MDCTKALWQIYYRQAVASLAPESSVLAVFARGPEVVVGSHQRVTGLAFLGLGK